MLGTGKYRTFLVVGAVTIALSLWFLYTHFLTPTQGNITTDLAQFDTLGTRVQDDFTAYPLVSLTDEYTLTDTLKDGVEITYGNRPKTEVSPRDSSRGLSSVTEPTPDTTFTTSDTTESLSLQFPQSLTEPLTITLPGNRTFTVTHNVEGTYTGQLLTNAASPRSNLGTLPRLDLGLAADEADPTTDPGSLHGAQGDDPAPTYLKYTSPDSRLHTYYAYQKDQAAGYRNLKHWTIFTTGTGHETQSYTFSNAHLTTNDRGEVEVRYLPSSLRGGDDPNNPSLRETTGGSDEAIQSSAAAGDVSEDLWARAQRVIRQDQLANITHTEPDLIIPAPYTIDNNGTQVTHEWVVTPASTIDPSDTSNNYILSVSFEVPLLGYPIALDPTLQFTAPGVSNSGDVITGEAVNSNFANTVAIADFNGDGKNDLAVSAESYDVVLSEGRVYVFYGGISTSEASHADVIISSETAVHKLGASLYSGDLNNDGVSDLIIGADNGVGHVYVFYGGELVSESMDQADIHLYGDFDGSSFGSSLSVGDYDNDGTKDLAVGAVYDFDFDSGRVYLFYNDGSFPTTATSADLTITAEGNINYFGISLATGDWNDDGKDDIAAGASYYGGLQGRAYIFYNDGAYPTTAGSADVIISGEATSLFGGALTSMDTNGDGIDDLVSSASNYNSQGRTYIYYGGSLGSSLNALSDADVVLTGETSSNFGTALSVGDINADGNSDLVVGASAYSSNKGRAYVFYGGNMASTSASAANVIMTGEATSNYFGSSLAVGDLNADGKDDLIVGATGYNSNQGRTYIFYSQSGQVNLNEHITGEGTSDYFGSAFAVGDFNSDGRDDLAVGAYKDNSNTGKVYIFYNDGEYTTSAGTADVVLTGESTSNEFGYTLTVSDLNADGLDDLVVGAYRYNNYTGRVYVFYSTSTPGSRNASAADVILTGESNNNYFVSLSTGDLNSDGVADLVVGAQGHYSGRGRAYFFYGGSLVSKNASAADVVLTGGAIGDSFGWSVSTGDYNTDGFDDVAVGSVYDSVGSDTYEGVVYVFYSTSTPGSRSAPDADVVFSGELSWSGFGSSLVSADLNHDGLDDLAIGAAWYNSSQGRAYIFYGGAMASENASGADVTLTGETTNNYFGYSLTTGDFNHDGTDDLAVGAYWYNSYQGRAYLFYNDGSYPSSATNADITITGDSANDDFGYALATGDFNADGKDDLVIGAPGYNNGGDTGRIYFYETREDYAWEIQRQSLQDGLRVDPLMGYEMKITGETTGNSFASAIAMADLNNDGKDDLIVGASGYNSYQGKVYIFYNDGNYPTKGGRADVTLIGETTNNYFGSSLTTGDFNHDGTDDLAVGAYRYNSYQGRAYLFYGGAMASENASGADVTLTGEATSNYFGSSLTTGDFNHDGTDDLAVGAYYYNSSQGRAYLFYGGAMASENASGADVTLTGEATNNLFGFSLTTGDLNNDGTDDLLVGATGYNSSQGRLYFYTTNDRHMTGEGTDSFFGSSFAIGDYNNDGKNDLAVGAYGWDDNNTGRVYLFYGGSKATTTASGADVTLTGESTSNYFGYALTTGDFNHDGTDDLAVGAYWYNSAQGRAYLFYGGAMASENASGADVTLTGEATSNFFGASLTTGDFNHDGTDDLAVGAYLYNSAQGRAYLFYGGAMASENASGADVTLTGEATSNAFGTSLTTGDFNHDGTDDLAVGAYGYNSSQGRAYLFYGGAMVSENASGADVTLTGENASDNYGYSLTTVDANHDGTDDLAVGAYWYNSAQGRAYLFYGGAMASENASGADVTLTGEATSNYFGYSLTTGDFNHDGTDDLAVGAHGYSTNTGRAYLFYGDELRTTGAEHANVIVTGEKTSSSFGYALTAGDLNGNGVDDLVIGSYQYDDPAVTNNDEGRVYILMSEAAAEHVSGFQLQGEVELRGNVRFE